MANPSNWGRWGAEDERGTLNLLTPELVRAAAGLVRTGKVYSLGLDLSKDAPVSAGRNQLWHRATRSDRPPPSHSGADDIVVMHTHTATHVDALCHIYYDGQLYNGFPSDEVTGYGA